MSIDIPIISDIFWQIFYCFEFLKNYLFPEIISFFYDPVFGLTPFGVLSLAGIGISIFFLLMRVVQNFLHFRG